MAVLPALDGFLHGDLSHSKNHGGRVAEGASAGLADGQCAGFLRTLSAEAVLAGEPRRHLSAAKPVSLVAIDTGGRRLDYDFMVRLARTPAVSVSARRLVLVSGNA